MDEAQCSGRPISEFKIDSTDRGPLTGKPVILPGGMMGDRATVFFAAPAEIVTLIKHRS